MKMKKIFTLIPLFCLVGCNGGNSEPVVIEQAKAEEILKETVKGEKTPRAFTSTSKSDGRIKILLGTGALDIFDGTISNTSILDADACYTYTKTNVVDENSTALNYTIETWNYIEGNKLYIVTGLSKTYIVEELTDEELKERKENWGKPSSQEETSSIGDVVSNFDYGSLFEYLVNPELKSSGDGNLSIVGPISIKGEKEISSVGANLQIDGNCDIKIDEYMIVSSYLDIKGPVSINVKDLFDNPMISALAANALPESITNMIAEDGKMDLKVDVKTNGSMKKGAEISKPDLSEYKKL